MAALALLELHPFRHAEAFAIRDALKAAGGRWDGKVWHIPIGQHSRLMILAAEIGPIKAHLWDQAGEDTGQKYAKKGTPGFAAKQQRFAELCKARGL